MYLTTQELSDITSNGTLAFSIEVYQYYLRGVYGFSNIPVRTMTLLWLYTSAINLYDPVDTYNPLTEKQLLSIISKVAGI